MAICLLRGTACFSSGWTSPWCIMGLDWTSNTVCGQSSGPWPLGCTALEHKHEGLQASQITKKYLMLCRSQTCLGASSRSHCKIKASNVFCVCPWQGQPSWRKYWWEMTLKLSTLETSGEHMALFCRPSNRIRNPSTEHSVLCIFETCFRRAGVPCKEMASSDKYPSCPWLFSLLTSLQLSLLPTFVVTLGLPPAPQAGEGHAGKYWSQKSLHVIFPCRTRLLLSGP